MFGFKLSLMRKKGEPFPPPGYTWLLFNGQKVYFNGEPVYVLKEST